MFVKGKSSNLFGLMFFIGIFKFLAVFWETFGAYHSSLSLGVVGVEFSAGQGPGPSNTAVFELFAFSF